MSFTGDLQQLPIVDVIQLLHTTRKSGVLRVKSRKGESQLVFKDGYIVSANHLNNSVRIGKLLVDLSIIPPEALDRALREQQNAGEERRPLIVTLLEKGLVREEDAYKGLEQLIELTVVEILTWRRGTFTLEPLPNSVADGYRYYPERMDREINVDTQSVLMDALRIFDEKVRDGALTEEEFPEEESPVISPDDLGLADLDQLERKIPEVFRGLAEIDPCQPHREEIEARAPWLSVPEREELASFLARFSAAPDSDGNAPRPVILFSRDGLLTHAVATVCGGAGISVHAAGDEEELEALVTRSLAGNSAPLLVLDSPDQPEGHWSGEGIASLRRQNRERYPCAAFVQLAPPDDAPFALRSYEEGVRAVLPRPLRQEHPESFVANLVRFLQGFQACIRDLAASRESSPVGRLISWTTRLRVLGEAPEVALALLQFVGEMCERSLTLIVRGSELVAEKGIGVRDDRGRGAAPAPGLRIPLAQSPLLRAAVEEGTIFYGECDDQAVRELLFAAIGAPLRPTVLLLPMKGRGRTISLTYGDFGGKEPSPPDTDLLAILTGQAELVLDNAFYRKRLGNPAR